jgi:DeoR family transcriptional regulator of aga operon
MSNHTNEINDSLLKIERQRHIRNLLEQQGRVTVLELSAEFSVSEATVRRDLEELSDQGWLHRTHGGALRVERAGREAPMLQRVTDQQDDKKRIGKAAAALVKDGETIFLGSGTTVLEIARRLPEGIRLTVITNSLPVVNELAQHPTVELFVIGGMLRQSEFSMVGHIAEQAVREFRADWVFMGMRAIDVRHGFTNDYLPETMTDRAILSMAPKVVVVADHSKFHRVSSVLVAPITAANLIITDKATSPEIVEDLQNLGVEVKVV